MTDNIMNSDLDTIFAELRIAAMQSRIKNDKWIVIDKICEYFEDFDNLSLYDFENILQRILKLIEEFPELDYGGPGLFGTFIEQYPFERYTPALLTSIQRQPSTQVLSWLDRSVMDEDFQNHLGENPITPQQFAKCLAQVLIDNKATQECKEFAQLCLTDLKKRGHVPV